MGRRHITPCTTWLKQRQVRRLVAEHKQHRHDRIVLVTGIRLQESERRMAAAISVPVRRSGAQVWVSPILVWSKRECHDYIRHRGSSATQVVDLLHRSGECPVVRLPTTEMRR